MIKREKYLKRLIAEKENGLTKIITGIRRCGKSYLLMEIYRNWLLENGVSESNIISIDLDSIEYAELRNPFELNKYIRNKCEKNKKNYVFIDEIQLVDKVVNPVYTNGKYVVAKDNDLIVITFVDLVLGLSKEKYIDLYVTGSNSKMLSNDIATELRGKATNIHIGPISFKEFFEYKNLSETEAVYEYMRYGGMPAAVLMDEESKKEYLKELFGTTYIKDILEHNKLTKTEALDDLCEVISENCGQLFNTERIANIYESSSKRKINKLTVEKYINYFIDAFILSEASRYDVKGNRKIGALRKYYFTDNGLRNAKLNFAYTDEGQMLENMVYNELIYNGFSVNIGAYEKVEKDKNGKSIKKNYEIDFVATKGIRKYYIQIASDISDETTRNRELKPFVSLNDQIRKIMVINKPIKETIDNNGFTIIGVAEFLLRFIVE